MRDHIVNVSDDETCDEATSVQTGVLNDLLLHRDAVCLSHTPPAEGLASSSVCACVCVFTVLLIMIDSDEKIFCFMCVSSDDSPSSAEKVQDCEVLLEPTLVGPPRGDGSTVSPLSLSH